MDTTLRDGEQTSGVSFAAHEKLSIAQALLDLGVNRLEIASARVSDGEFEAVKRVASWAERTGNIQKHEVLGFVDGVFCHCKLCFEFFNIELIGKWFITVDHNCEPPFFVRLR